MPQNSKHSGVLSALAVFPSFSGYTNTKQQGGEKMAKKGMKRPEVTHTKPKNEVDPVPELQGKAKHSKEKAKPIVKP